MLRYLKKSSTVRVLCPSLLHKWLTPSPAVITHAKRGANLKTLPAEEDTKIPSTPRYDKPKKSTLPSQTVPPITLILDQFEDSDEESDPTSAYVSLRLKQDEVGSSTDPGTLHGLQQRLQKLENDPLFDKQLAMKLYRKLKVEQDRRLHHERLSKPIIEESSNPHNVASTAPSNTQTSTEASFSTLPKARPRSPSCSSDSDASSADGIFGGLEDAMATELTVKGITYQMKDMSLPKNWSGQTPKKLLSDSVLKVDRYATITYSVLSGHSRAVRAAVTVSWRDENRPASKWSMEDIACPEFNQAEQYIALVAFHALTYPSTEGFAVILQPGTTSFRLLPLVYREVWDQLEVRRNENNIRLNLGVWKQLLLVAKQRGGSVTHKVRCFLLYAVNKSVTFHSAVHQGSKAHKELTRGEFTQSY